MSERLPTLGDPNVAMTGGAGTQLSSVVVAIRHDADRLDVADETVTTIFETFAVPECARDLIVGERERALGGGPGRAHVVAPVLPVPRCDGRRYRVGGVPPGSSAPRT